MISTSHIASTLKADVLVYDADGVPLLVVEIKSLERGEECRDQVLAYQRGSQPPIPYGMAVDPETIVLMKDEQGGPREIVLSTVEVLGHYEPNFGNKRIFEYYFAVLVEGWLRDLIFRWKSEEPPGLEAVRSLGLLDHLRGATTRIEAPIHGHFVR
jgi:hypothetical protein